MKFKNIHEREENREVSRRALLGWMTAAGACLSIPAWKVKEIISGTHGKAFAAGSQAAARSVFLDMGVGALSWITQLFPWRSIGEGSNGNSYLFEGQGRLLTGTDRPMFASPAGLLAIGNGEGRIGMVPTLLHAGNAQTHTRQSTNSTTLANGNELTSASSLMQISNTHLLSGLGVNNPNIGNVPGAPGFVALNSPAAMVTTFESAATAAEGILFSQPDAELFDANMSALLKLHRAIDKPTLDKGIKAGQVSGKVVGLDIAQLVTPTAQDEVRYGLAQGAGGDNRIQAMARYLMVAEKMIELSLVSNFKLQLFNDDPHGAFNNPTGSQEIALSIGRALGAFWAKMGSTVDPLGQGQTLAEEVTMQIGGDTAKTIFAPGGWGDNPRGGMFSLVWGRGRLRTGQFGQCNRAAQNFDSWDPVSGNPVQGRTSNDNATLAAHAMLYATGSDERLVNELAGQSGPTAVNILDVDG